MIRDYKNNLIDLTNKVTNKIKRHMLKKSKTHMGKSLFVKKKKKTLDYILRACDDFGYGFFTQTPRPMAMRF